MLDPQTEHWLTNGLTEVTTDTTDTTAHNKQPIPVSAHRLETTVCIWALGIIRRVKSG